MDTYKIYNEDCINAAKILEDSSIDMFLCDPPFGLGESTFDKHYKRNKDNVTRNYVEAPDDYEKWCVEWLSIAKTKVKQNGTIYVVSGWTKLADVLNATAKCGLNTINHIIWKYNFGVFTKKKFVSSHYHILMLSKASPKFNPYCRYGPNDKLDNGNKALYSDLEDVFSINKEYMPYKEGELKNTNKLPDALVEKLIMYSTDQNDTVCDFFMGNFTTAYNSIRLGRKVVGFEINKDMFDYHVPKLAEIKFGSSLDDIRIPNIDVPKNTGKKFQDGEKEQIWKDYLDCLENKKMKVKDTYVVLQEKYNRGKFSIKNVIDAFKNKDRSS